VAGIGKEPLLASLRFFEAGSSLAAPPAPFTEWCFRWYSAMSPKRSAWFGVSSEMRGLLESASQAKG
jgi:hypothetical protein